MAALQAFSRNEVTPRSFERLECRLERLGRELARLLLQQTVSRVESPERPGPMVWEHRKFRPNRRTFRTMETRLGTIQYRPYMDYATRRLEGDPIGSGVTEAGCKVIFNQRFKQSGMRWSNQGGQTIVDLRTACRSGLWQRIWTRWLASHTRLPEIKQVIPFPRLAAA